MSPVRSDDTAESAKGRSPADIYAVMDDVPLHRLRPTHEDTYPVPIVLVPSLLSHNGVMAGHKARHVLWPTLSAWLGARSGVGG